MKPKNQTASLEDRRFSAAEAAYQDAKFENRVEDQSGWETDGLNRMRRDVFMDVGTDNSHRMIFAVEFRPGSAELAMDPEYSEPEWQGAPAEPAAIFGYYINLDERGEFFADVRDRDGQSLMVIKAPDEEGGSVFEDGFMRDKDDIEGLRAHLLSLGVLSRDDELLEMSAFEARIEAEKTPEPSM